jgi:hypothetical protein
MHFPSSKPIAAAILSARGRFEVPLNSFTPVYLTLSKKRKIHRHRWIHLQLADCTCRKSVCKRKLLTLPPAPLDNTTAYGILEVII